MTEKTIIFTGCVFCALLLVSVLVSAETKESASPPTTGAIVCKTKHYTVSFSSERAWTIRDIAYDGRLISLHNGFHGTVLAPKGGKWWGTGHTEGGREVVRALRLSVDGKETPIRPGHTYEGRRISLRKHSGIWKFDAEEDVMITDGRIIEHTRLRALEDSELSVLYFFMHCTPPTTTKWIAELPDGKLAQGALPSSGKMQVNRPTRWLAQFDPTLRCSILYYTPKVIDGPRSASMIWDLKHYHKCYLRQNRGQKFRKGDTLDYSVIVEVVPDEKGDWAATKKAAALLKKSFPDSDNPEQ